MKPIEEDIEMIDDLVSKLTNREHINVCDRYSTIARLLETKAMLVSVQQDAEMSLEDL